MPSASDLLPQQPSIRSNQLMMRRPNERRVAEDAHDPDTVGGATYDRWRHLGTGELGTDQAA